MRRLTIIAATALLVAGAAPALATCEPTVQVGTFTGDPEKDTLGFVCVADHASHTSSLSGVPRREIVQIGVRTGQPETDTFGYALLPLQQSFARGEPAHTRLVEQRVLLEQPR